MHPNPKLIKENIDATLFSFSIEFKTTFDPWTIQVWTAQVHGFFSLNAYCGLYYPQLVESKGMEHQLWGGQTVKSYVDFWLQVGLMPLSPPPCSSRVNCIWKCLDFLLLVYFSLSQALDYNFHEISDVGFHICQLIHGIYSA